MRIYLFVLCLIGPVLSSCTDSSADPMAGVPFVNAPYEVVSQGTQQGITNQQLHVVTNDAQLAALAATATFNPAIPAIDFGANRAVAIFTGLGTGCVDKLRIINVSEGADIFLVEVEKSVPGDGVVCPAFVPDYGPYLLATIPKSGKPVSFAFTIKKVG